MDNTNEPPRDVVRDGNLKASIWRNEGGDKGHFYSVSFARVYTDREGQARDAHSFSGTDLLRVSELARKTYDRTQDMQREDRLNERNRQERADAPSPAPDDRAERKQQFEARRTQPQADQKRRR